MREVHQMKIAREFCHRAYDDRRFVREEAVELGLEIESTTATLEITQEVQPVGDNDRTLRTLDIERLDIVEVDHICENLSNWCRDRSADAVQFETGIVEGRWKTGDGEEPVEQLLLYLSEEGLEVHALKNRNRLGTIRVPSRVSSRGGEDSPPEHLHSLNTLLNLARAWSDTEMSSARPALDAGGEFTGPLHERIEDHCVRDYYENLTSNSVATAGQHIERAFKEVLDDEYTDMSASDLIGRALADDDSLLVASENPDQQQGVYFLYQGAIKALRNPLTHRDPSPDDGQFPDHVSKRFARDALYFFDLLFLILEEELEAPDDTDN